MPTQASFFRLGGILSQYTAILLVVLLSVEQIFKLKNQNQLEGSGEGYVCSLQGKGQDCVRTPEVDITFTADRVVPPKK